MGKIYMRAFHPSPLFSFCVHYYNIFKNMDQVSVSKMAPRNKAIKNIYIHKINSLIKIIGNKHSSMPCLTKARKNILSESQDFIALQRKQNNKDAARKARMRKKIYMDLLEQTLQNLQQLNEEGKQLQKQSRQMLGSLQNEQNSKQIDEIGIYLSNQENEGIRKEESQQTLDGQKECELKKILMQMQMVFFPSSWKPERIDFIQTNQDLHRLQNKMEEIQSQLPQIFSEVKNICSDHSSLMISNEKKDNNYDPYFTKTLVEEYFSKTMCRKDAVGYEIERPLNLLIKMEKFQKRAQIVGDSDFPLQS